MTIRLQEASQLDSIIYEISVKLRNQISGIESNATCTQFATCIDSNACRTPILLASSLCRRKHRRSVFVAEIRTSSSIRQGCERGYASD
jgi:hypothetical protein